MHSLVQKQITIALFPLGVVLMPKIHLPLHIFEERYKAMIRECLEQQNAFGIVYYSGKQLMSSGCTARIVEVLKRYEDGRSDIMTFGENRFQIKEIIDRKPYLQAQVELFDDEDEEQVARCRRLAADGLESLKELNTLTGQGVDDGAVDALDFKTVSFQIASCEGFSLEEKQTFLELTSTYQRLKMAVESLGKIIKRLKLTQEIHKIINGNGNLPHVLQRQSTESRSD